MTRFGTLVSTKRTRKEIMKEKKKVDRMLKKKFPDRKTVVRKTSFKEYPWHLYTKEK